jgi:hypothetical protein
VKAVTVKSANDLALLLDLFAKHPVKNIHLNIKDSLEILYVDASVLHVICRGTRFSATSFLYV